EPQRGQDLRPGRLPPFAPPLEFSDALFGILGAAPGHLLALAQIPEPPLQLVQAANLGIGIRPILSRAGLQGLDLLFGRLEGAGEPLRPRLALGEGPSEILPALLRREGDDPLAAQSARLRAADEEVGGSGGRW